MNIVMKLNALESVAIEGDSPVNVKSNVLSVS